MIIRRPTILVTAVAWFLLAGNSAGLSQAQVGDVTRVPVPRVTLNSSTASLAPGGRVTFAAQLSSGYPNIRFNFDFGDGAQSGWQSSAVAIHVYRNPGSYRPFVDIGVATGSGVSRLGGSVRRLVQVTDATVGRVDLFINPAATETGRPVTLSVRSTSNNPNLRYRFKFGDSSPIGGWQTNPQTSHVYPMAGSYIASVDVAVMTNRGLQLQGSSRRGVSVLAPADVKVARSDNSKKNRREIRGTAAVAKASSVKPSAASASTIKPVEKQTGSSVKPTSSPIATPSPVLSPHDSSDGSSNTAGTARANDWSKYWWLLLPLALLAFIVGKLFFGKPEIRSHADPGTASVVDAKGLVRNSEVVFTGAKGQSEVASSGPLVKNVSKENG